MRGDRGMDCWESAPSAQRWLCKDEEALPLPGEPSSRMLHRQAMMLSGFPPQGVPGREQYW